MPSPAWLLVVWWIKGHSCFNWLDFQLINSQVVFAALLALDSPYGICNKKIPFLSASEIATKPEELTPKRCATQKVLQNEQHTLAHWFFNYSIFWCYFSGSYDSCPIHGKERRKYLHHRLPSLYIKVQLSSKADLAFKTTVKKETGRILEIPLK